MPRFILINPDGTHMASGDKEQIENWVEHHESKPLSELEKSGWKLEALHHDKDKKHWFYR